MGLLIPRNRVALLRREFSPDDLGGLRLWLPADSITGVADGGAVATWPDRSGNAYDAAQATAGNRPTLELGEINGKPVVRFTAASVQSLGLSGAALGLLRNVPGCTAFLVYKCNNADGGDPLAFWVSTSGAAARFGHAPGFTTNSVEELRARTADADAAAAAAGGIVTDGSQFHMVTCYADYANGILRVYHGNALLGSGTLASSGNTADTDSATIAVGDSNAGNPFDGDLAEIIVYDRALADGEMAMVRRYLSKKYALALGPLLVSGAASGAVSLDANVLINGDMESGNPPSNWSGSNATLAANASTMHSGAQSLAITRTGGFGLAYQGVTLTVGRWYKLAVWGYISTAGGANVIGPRVGSTYTDPGTNDECQLASITTKDVWVNGLGYFIATGASRYVSVLIGNDVNDIGLADDITLYPIVFSTLCTLLGDPAVQIALYRTDGLTVAAQHVAGLLICATDNDGDASTYALYAVADRTLGKARLFKIEAGTTTELTSGTITYADSAELEIRVNGVATASNVSIYYNGTIVGTVQTVNLTLYGTKVYRFGTAGAETFIVEVQPA